MKLTAEQHSIINSSGNIKINAVAGSGKTTTIIEYAKALPTNARILYLAFNKSVKLQAVKKFADSGLTNVKVETAHSLAYRYIVRGSSYKICPQGYKSHQIAQLLGLQVGGEKLAEYIVANHINKFITYFCNSSKAKVQELNYLDVLHDAKARIFVKSHYRFIEKQTRVLLSKMNKAEIEITHDFYLKKFQLSSPRLNYDYILFDEGQDASPAMLDIFMKQTATKVIVGDTHQQIYGWRYAVNSLAKADFKSLKLSTSFRFGQHIANLALKILDYKELLDRDIDVQITGKGNTSETKSMATIARTNLGLLLKAIEYISDKPHSDKIYFEGNINSYTYADDGASLYDVLNLYNHKHRLIKDMLIKKMKNLDDLTEYIEKTEDVQLGMMVEVVKKYGNEIPDIIRELKEKHVDGDDKEKADMIFSTVHRSKGMEYDTVWLANDFITENLLEKSLNEKKQAIDTDKLNEEINLLYVAITRAKKCVRIPESLLPQKYYPHSKHIHIEKLLDKFDGFGEFDEFDEFGTLDDDDSGFDPEQHKSDYYGKLHKIKQNHKAAYQLWTLEQDDELTVMYCQGASVADMAEYFGRTKGSIRSRIIKLELKDLYG